MVVLVLTACPAGLRGHLTRWLLEIGPGVFVGRVSARVRDLMWLRVLDLCKDGRAIMVHTAENEQGLSYRVHRHEWQPEDFDGVWLMRRPVDRDEGGPPALRKGLEQCLPDATGTTPKLNLRLGDAACNAVV